MRRFLRNRGAFALAAILLAVPVYAQKDKDKDKR